MSRTWTPTPTVSPSSGDISKRKVPSTPRNGIHRSSKRGKKPESPTSKKHNQQSEETKEENVVTMTASSSSPHPSNTDAPLASSESRTISIPELREAPEEGKVMPNKIGLSPIIVEQLALLDKYRQASRGSTALTADQYAKKLLPIYTTMQKELDVVSNRLSFFRVWLPALMTYVLGRLEFKKLVDDGSISPLETKRDLEHLDLWRWFIEHDLDYKVRDSLAAGQNKLTLADIRHAHKIVSSKGGLYTLHCVAVCFYVVLLSLMSILQQTGTSSRTRIRVPKSSLFGSTLPMTVRQQEPVMGSRVHVWAVRGVIQ
jgi:hypothetical protein